MPKFIGDDPLAALISAIELGNTPAALSLVREGAALDSVLARTLHGSHTWWSTPLIAAVMNRNIDVFEALLRSGANPDVALPNGLTPLEFAATAGIEVVARRLIEHGADVEPRGERLRVSGQPMLHCAAHGGNLNIVKLLLDRGADASAMNEYGQTALDIALKLRHERIAVYLRERMIASQRPLGIHEAAADGLLDRVVEILDAGTPVDSREPVRQRTALHLAVLREHLKVARVLIERGADVNARDGLGHVCLSLCRNYDSVRLLKFLLQSGADPNSDGPGGLTPLLWHLKERAGIKIVRILLDAGADVRARTADDKDDKGALELTPSDNPSVRRHIKDLLGVAPDEIDQLRDHLTRFPVLSQEPAFQALAGRLGNIFGRRPAPWKHGRGGIYFHGVSLLKYPARHHGVVAQPGSIGDQTLQLFVNVQEDVRAEGFTLLHTEPRPSGERASLILLPTANQYAAVLAHGTNGANHGHSTRAILSWLMEMERVNPFVLTGCGFDFLIGRFAATVKEPEDWARKVIVFCPDLDAGAPDQARRLAGELLESGWFYLWWD